MKLYRCASCGESFEGPRAVLGGVLTCPHCGEAVPAEHTLPEGDLIIDVRARADDGSPTGPPQDEPAQTARPIFDQRSFSGRVFPGGPTIQGQTWVFRSGGPNDGRGCCGCGLVVFALLMIVFVRGCASFFN